MLTNYMITVVIIANLNLDKPRQVVLVTTIIITNYMITIAIIISNLNLAKPGQVAEIKLFQSLKGAQGVRWHLLQLKSEKPLRIAKYFQTS